MLLYASSVTSAIVRKETGTEIYSAAKLLSAATVEAKLCQTETLTRLKKQNHIKVRLEMLSQFVHTSDQNANIHT